MIEDKTFFRTLVENGSDAILTIDERSEIVFANESVRRVFGYESEEIIGEPLTIVIPERFQEAHFEAIDRYLETGSRGFDWNSVELPGTHKEGHEVPLSITFEEHPYDDRRLFSGIIRDISARKQYERSLERQNERLDRFAGIVSHDLRNPLNTAMAQLSLAQADAESEYFADLERTHERMAALIEDVLTLTRQGRTVGEIESVPFESVVTEAWTTAGSETATLELDGDLEEIIADEERLRTVLENLFANAVHHGGAQVTVSIGRLPDGGFYVMDDGTGIPKSDREDVFEYGHTGSEEGTGLGLSIVRSIAEAHNWRVDLAPSDGGARFEFTTS